MVIRLAFELPLPCIPDSISGYLGPLAGVLADLSMRENGFEWIASVAADTIFSQDFVFRARAAADEYNAPGLGIKFRF